MRTWAAWIVGIATYIGLSILAGILGELIGVPVQIYFDEPIIIEHRYYDEEKDSAFTAFGLAITILCGMAASRIGMAIHAKSWRGGVGLKGEYSFLAWAMGLCIYGIVGILIFLASRNVHNDFANFLFNVFDIVSGAGIAWAMYHWHNLRVAHLSGNQP